ncbi:N-alpha-acetyltransferase 25 NatB auxiliary subunit [Biomphalaria pfeifferi]|uniref:N-alpha-acetyltransferase 25 NatB auxiliary subunit n=1 Tax=Biomphalaria pfeifferi TaxID=112525 RepID=A0AAD8B540_BIOPF|nr:N-alpha-acetyltransferase 25 NatB auxiliary subunit [Biomphalaria pfeifferi]
MASRSHVDINERRLRPIYDCLDNGNNKKAIQEADKVLKKQKDLTCAKVLKALALLRMGRHAEGSSLLSTIHQSEPTEEQTLNAMSICYKETQQYDKIASLYDAASKQQPNNEDILSCLFMAHVRLGNYQQQQRTAMQLHKLRPKKNPYYFWAVMSIVMQAYQNEQLGKTMFLPLAEKMIKKYIQEDKIEAEAEIHLYLIILELQQNWTEALQVLEGPLGAFLGNELHSKETRLATICSKLSKWDRVSSIYKQLLDQMPDNWDFWLKYQEAVFHLVEDSYRDMKQEPSSDDSTPNTHAHLEAMQKFIEDKIQSMQNGVMMRGPYLAEIEFVKQISIRKLTTTSINQKSALKLLQEYFQHFGNKSSCYNDIKLYLDLLQAQELDQLLEFMKSDTGLESSDGSLIYARDVNQLTKHLVYLQLTRTMGKHSLLSIQEALALSQELLLRYRDGLQFGKELLPTDIQYSDNYLLLAVHLLLDVWSKTKDDVHLWRAIVHLELAIRDSVSNYQIKLLLIRLYCRKGVFGPCPALYDGMEIKHIMNDTLGHIVSNDVIRLGHFMEAGTMYATMVRFFVVNQKEASEHLMSSYKFGSFGRIHEFVQFQERLDNSLQYHTASTEKMLLELIMQTDRHESTEAAANGMNVHPLTDKTIDLSKLCDNRDLTLALAWDPPELLCATENRQKSFEEEKSWLLLRWTLLHVLLLAVMVGQEMAGVGVVNGNEENTEKKSPLKLLRQRAKDLQNCVQQCQGHKQPNQYHVVQGPSRTRLAEFVSGPHITAVTSVIDCIEYVYSLSQSGLDECQDVKVWALVKDSTQKLVLKDVQGLLKDCDGKRQLDSLALEQLVASVESISYITIMLGVCSKGLKILKNDWLKKFKKNKALHNSQPEIFDKFNQLILDVSASTKELHQIASCLDPVFSSLDIASLRLADIPDEEQIQREAERLVWTKVESSVQQSSGEICEVLHHKQFYLNTLML